MRFLALLSLLSLLAGPAWAGDERRAGEIQRQAKDALAAGDADEALRLAERAISLEDGPSTWLAQQIRIEILEDRGDLGGAMKHLRAYLEIDGLFPEHRAWGEEARKRLGAKLDAVEQARGVRRGVGGALLGVGAVPLGLGIASLANYGDKTAAGNPAIAYEGYLDAGVVGLVVGGAMEGVGAALLASTAGRGGVASAPLPWAVADADRVLLGLSGRF